MNPEEIRPTSAPVEGALPVENISSPHTANINMTTNPDRTPVERVAEAAREQAGEAAAAFRRGEFMHEATVDNGANSDDRLIALLAYIIPVLLPVLVLLSESSNKRPFQRYHAVQSLGLSIVLVMLSVLVSIGTAIIQVVPLIGTVVGLVVLCLTPIALLMVLIAMLYYGYQAYQGKRFAIPGLTAFLRDQGWL